MEENNYRFLMVSAMYENGGNTTQRHLDGHPQLFSYPFESQLGTKFVCDCISSLYPLKYRWPVFPVGVSPEELYEMIIDEETKVCSKTKDVSKFRKADFQLTDPERKKLFVSFLKNKELSNSTVLEAFFRATILAWKNYNVTGREQMYVGYSPIVVVDADKIVKDYGKNGYVLQVVRNPFSAYADTKKRAVPLSIDHYMLGWNTNQYYATLYASIYPENVFILRYEDLIQDSKCALSAILDKMGLESSDALNYPSWNGQKLEEVYPWGTIKTPTPEDNIEKAKELSQDEIDAIYQRTHQYLEQFDYKDIHQKITKPAECCASYA